MSSSSSKRGVARKDTLSGSTTSSRMSVTMGSNSSSGALYRSSQEDNEDGDTTALLHNERHREQDNERQGELGLFLRLRVKPTIAASLNECELTIPSRTTVGALRESIRQKYSLSEDEMLRLIYAGKLLSPDTAEIAQFGVKSDVVIHAVISKIDRSTPRAPVESERFRERDGNQAISPPPPPRGLDVLIHSFPASTSSSVTLSAEEVSAMRVYFGESIAAYERENMQRRDGESERDFALRVETQWMHAQPPLSEFRLNVSALRMMRGIARDSQGAQGYDDEQAEEDGEENELTRFLRDAPNTLRETQNTTTTTHAVASQENTGHTMLTRVFAFNTSADESNHTGTARDFLTGMMVGYWLGFLMLFCVFDANVPYLQKLGLICGVMLSLVFDIVFGPQNVVQNVSNKSSSGVGQPEVVPVIVSDKNVERVVRFLRIGR